jgi:carbon-monoxide dehydrogenase medium subunit
MQPFSYARPGTLAEAVALLEASGPAARVLAGGTDLVIRLRDGTVRPSVVVDLKRIDELRPAIRVEGERLVVSATSVMTDVMDHPLVRWHFTALAEAASVVGSVQIRNRATVAGNLCNASPAADTAPALLVFGAAVVAVGPAGTRRIPLDGFFVRSGVTTLLPAEIVTAVELPLPPGPLGSAHVRRTRRRGHDLASVTLSVAIDGSGVTRLAYGSVGPRPVLYVDETGVLADPAAPDEARASALELAFAAASPSATSMRASPEYRLAMLRVLARRALRAAGERLAGGVR